MNGTMAGVTIAPTFVPALKMPVASGEESRHRRGVLHAEHRQQRAHRRPEYRCLGRRHGGKGPDGQRQGVAFLRAEDVHDPAGKEEADRIRELKRKHQIAVIDFAPAELPLQQRLENADHLAVDVIDGGGEEEQAADDPAEISTRWRGGGRDSGAFCRHRGHKRSYLTDAQDTKDTKDTKVLIRRSAAKLLRFSDESQIHGVRGARQP
jgi:hypothetical protein